MVLFSKTKCDVSITLCIFLIRLCKFLQNHVNTSISLCQLLKHVNISTDLCKFIETSQYDTYKFIEKNSILIVLVYARYKKHEEMCLFNKHDRVHQMLYT